MSVKLTTEELRERLDRFLRERAACTRADWPDLFRTIRVADCDGPAAQVLFAYDTLPWMANVMGVVHGGVTATLLDSCMGIACGVHADAVTPTITMTVNYVRPVPLNVTLHVRTHTVRVGRTTVHATGEVFLPDRPDELLATACGVYSPAASIAR